MRAQFEMPKFNLPKFGDSNTQKPASNNIELKKKLLDICASARQGIDGTGSATQAEFDDLVEELIAKNPTPDAAESSLMTGTWKMVFLCVLFGLCNMQARKFDGVAYQCCHVELY